jgi:hypothetical protein
MEELKVPKSRTPVDVQLADGSQHSVSLFLSTYAADHPGGQRVSDLLNGGEEFIAAFDMQADEMTFLNRRNISVAYVPAEAEADRAEQYTLPEETEVRVTMLDGSRLTGLLSYVRPAARSRVIDFLNEHDLFFPLLVKERVALINKLRVLRVELLARPNG